MSREVAPFVAALESSGLELSRLAELLALILLEETGKLQSVRFS